MCGALVAGDRHYRLAEERDDPWGFDWTPTVGDCLRVVLEEEWAHLRYTRRDLEVLADRADEAGSG